MNKICLNLLLLSAFGSFSSCLSFFVNSGIEGRIEAPQKKNVRLPISPRKNSSQSLLEQYGDKKEKIDQSDDKLKNAKKKNTQTEEMSAEEYALETLMNIASDIEKRINRSAFLPQLVTYKKEFDLDATKQTDDATKKLFDGLAKELSVGFINTTGSFIVNQGFYHFLGVKNVRSPATEIVTYGLEFAQALGFSRTPSQFAAIALLLSNVTNSVIDSCIKKAEWLTGPVEVIIARYLNTEETQQFILDNALFFDSSDLAHNLLEKVLLSKGMANSIQKQFGLNNDNPLLWLHQHADMGIAGVRICSLINDAKKQTYDFDIEKILDGLEDGSISVSEGTRIAQTLLSTMQEITGLLQKATKTDDKDAGTVRTHADSAITQMRSMIQSLQGQILDLNRMGAINGMAALADMKV